MKTPALNIVTTAPLMLMIVLLRAQPMEVTQSMMNPEAASTRMFHCFYNRHLERLKIRQVQLRA